ncbi:(2Fe-2S)-binding protein [Agrobacterium cavarae]|uniref:(2Fe-2S)-binding protein n=1 Tax=Agrobacterium cavarae TaxID=2528239 RepID=UPI0028B0F61E|nr:(2Fe-2S)-binding protein [Agrobacterium cavarae]
MMNDYSYILAAATVPLFTGFGLISGLEPASVGLRFYTTERLHEGKIYRARRAHVQFVESLFWYGQLDNDIDGERFRTELEKHFRPVVEQIHTKTGLSRAALWRLAGDAIAYLFLDTGRRFDTVKTAKAAAMRILKVPGSPLANRELQYFELAEFDRHQQEVRETFLQRGGCCRFYQVEGGAYCSTCVLKTPADRDDELRRALRDQLGVS